MHVRTNRKAINVFDWVSVLFSGEGFVELLTLIFLEIVLGIDNLAFIAITTDRLPDHHAKSLGRRLGLAGALCMRILLLCTITWVMSLTTPLLTIDSIVINGEPFAFTGKSIILLCGGVYLIYKGIKELVEVISCKEEAAEAGHPDHQRKTISIGHAVALIMVMDIVFSLDSVITAVGMVGELAIMITAVIVAVALMIIFADIISDFISDHVEVKILALTFIALVGIVLTCKAFNIEIPDTVVYGAMIFSLIITLFQMKYRSNLAKVHAEAAAHHEALAAQKESASEEEASEELVQSEQEE